MDRKRLEEMSKNPGNIPGIYNYCDRWCERCTFTSKCLSYAMEQEDPLKDDPEANDIQNEKFWNRISENFKLTLEMVREDAKKFGIDLDNLPEDPDLDKRIKNRHEYAHNHPLSKKAGRYMKKVDKWFKESERLFIMKAGEIQHKMLIELKDENPERDVEQIRDAADIIKWYFMQINVKLMRAFSSRYLDEAEGWDMEDRKDSDGSAKVSLIGIDRSIAAWVTMLGQFPEEEKNILDMLVQLEQLKKGIEKEFPGARSFKRPGFDD